MLWDVRPLGLTGGKVEKVRPAAPDSSILGAAYRATRARVLSELSKNFLGKTIRSDKTVLRNDYTTDQSRRREQLEYPRRNGKRPEKQ